MSEPTIPDETGEARVEAPPIEVPSELSAEESAELDVYSNALPVALGLLEAGRPSEALAMLNLLPAPSTEAGAAFWPVIELMKRIPRATLHTLSGEKQEALAEWQAVRAEAPPVPGFDQVRRLADGMILIQEKDVSELTEEEYQSLLPQIQMLVNQQRALRLVSPALKSAWEAMARNDEAEYANQMASVERSVDRAGAENPATKPMIEGFYGMTELLALAMRQQQDFDRFDFDRVSASVAPIEAMSKQLASSKAATTPQVIPMAWIPDMATSVARLGLVTDRLSRLLQTLLSHETTAKQLEEISQIQDQIREQQRNLGGLKVPVFVESYRKLPLDVSGKLQRLTERLSLEVHPTRRTLLNVTGLVSAISFVTVAALLLLVGRVTGTDLNAGVVLALSAFFGLVAGFGYGALRFRGFLTSVLFGPGQESGN
jgi:hypothetical protein